MRATVERFHLEPEDMSPVQLVAEVRRLRAHVDGLSEDKQRLRRECGCLASDALSDCCDVKVSPYWERRFVSPWERVK